MLHSGRLKTARVLAERLQVSERTIYRDVRDLQLAGQPIEGEAGVGYTLRRQLEMPPLMFTVEELTSIVLGARLVQAWGGEESFEAVNSALARIEAVLPPHLTAELSSIVLYAPPYSMKREYRKRLDQLHHACRSKNVIEFEYVRLGEEASRKESRSVWPLALAFWGGVWTLGAWCETRKEFRSFRMDRMSAVVTLPREFNPKRGQRLEDFVRQVQAEAKPSKVVSRKILKNYEE